MNTTLNKISFALSSLSGDLAKVAGGLVLLDMPTGYPEQETLLGLLVKARQAEESRDDEE
jgi:hypothetical protein